MANYTIELYKLLESYGFELFDFEYSFYCDDEKVKKDFEQKFKDYYMFREIGQETVSRFKHQLKTLLNIKMPYYKQLYETELKSKDINFMLNKDLSMEDIQFFNTTAPYVADKLRQERYELEREILTFLGLNNNFEKSERLLVDEVNSNNDFIIRNAELMFEQRKKACKEINEMFGLNITVINKNAPKDLPKEEEDING